jgi:hypothetical protein
MGDITACLVHHFPHNRRPLFTAAHHLRLHLPLRLTPGVRDMDYPTQVHPLCSFLCVAIEMYLSMCVYVCD